METAIIIARHAERAMLEVFCREAITPCVQTINKARPKDDPIPLTFQVMNTKKNAKSNVETFYATSVHSLSPWEAFYRTEAASDLDRCSLDNIYEKAEGLSSFLVHRPKSKFQLIQFAAERDQLSMWALISSVIRTAIWRKGEGKFVDKEAGARVGRLIALYEQKTITMASAGHAKKHDEDMATTLISVNEAFQTRINDTFFPPYTEELPPLPIGAVLPISRVVKQIMGRE